MPGAGSQNLSCGQILVFYLLRYEATQVFKILIVLYTYAFISFSDDDIDATGIPDLLSLDTPFQTSSSKTKQNQLPSRFNKNNSFSKSITDITQEITQPRSAKSIETNLKNYEEMKSKSSNSFVDQYVTQQFTLGENRFIFLLI